MNAFVTTMVPVEITSSSSKIKSSSPAKRCLFARPDPLKLDKWLTEKLDEIGINKQLRWSLNFQFDECMPCGSGESDYIVTAVPAESVRSP